jgi:class 3 adenylate cyclase
LLARFDAKQDRRGYDAYYVRTNAPSAPESFNVMESTTNQPDQPTAGTLSSNRVVVFADVLGFAALTEANPVERKRTGQPTRRST